MTTVRRIGAELAGAAECVRTGMVGWVPPRALPGMLRGVRAHGQIGMTLALATARCGDRTAVLDERGAVTFRELDRTSNALAHALRDKGLTDRSTVAILCRNHRGLLQALFAAAKIGATILLLNTDFAAPQTRDVCAREGVDLAIHDDEFAPRFEGSAVPRVRAWDDGGRGPTVDELTATGATTALPRPRSQSRLVLLTSGTTGTPKGAPRTVSRSLTLPGGFLAKIPFRARRTVVLAAPIFHGWGMLTATMTLALGNTLVLHRRFDPATTVDALHRHRADALVVVPIMLARILQSGVDGSDLGALRIIAAAGSALPESVCRDALRTFGPVLYNFYGSTEVAVATIAGPADLAAAPGTVGRPPLATEVRLLDEHGHPVPPGAQGWIFVRNIIQFAGYTGGGGKELVDGMMSTGDVGHLDAAGRLFVDGRDDDMIVSGGENVFSREVEELLLTHATVADVAVVGAPDPEYGQRLVAYVVPGPGAVVDGEALREFVKSTLARYKVPREVIALDRLPRNPAGKLVRRELP